MLRNTRSFWLLSGSMLYDQLISHYLEYSTIWRILISTTNKRCVPPKSPSLSALNEGVFWCWRNTFWLDVHNKYIVPFLYLKGDNAKAAAATKPQTGDTECSKKARYDVTCVTMMVLDCGTMPLASGLLIAKRMGFCSSASSAPRTGIIEIIMMAEHKIWNLSSQSIERTLEWHYNQDQTSAIRCGTQCPPVNLELEFQLYRSCICRMVFVCNFWIVEMQVV